MKHAGSVLGFLAPLAEPVRYKRRRNPIRLAGGRGQTPSPRTLPWGFYKQRVTRTHKNDPPETYPLHCFYFKYCDKAYQDLCPDQRASWRRGIKRPRISPYDLFMSEALRAAHERWPLPDAPSLSGGFTTKHVKPGTKIPTAPLPSVLVPTSKITWVRLEAHYDDRPPHTDLVWDYCEGDTPPPDPADQVLWASRFDPEIGKYRSTKATHPSTGRLVYYRTFEPNEPHQVRLYQVWPGGLLLCYAYCTLNIDWRIERWDQKPWLPPPDFPEPWL